MDDKAAGVALRAAVGRQWSLLTAMQYLSGQEATGALKALPESWSEEGLTKEGALEAIVLANDACANAHPGGTPLLAGLLVRSFKREA